MTKIRPRKTACRAREPFMGWLGAILSILFFCSLMPHLSQAQDSTEINALSFEHGSVLLEYSTEFGTKKRPEWIALGLIDGTTKLGWSSKNLAPFPHEFLFELAQPYLIDALEFDNTDSEEAKLAGISAIKVTVSASSSSRQGPYGVIFHGPIQAGELSRIDLATPASLRWIKLVISENGGHPEYTELMEFRAISKIGPAGERSALVTSGTYETNWNLFYLEVEDGQLVGCYDHDHGRFNGSLTGNFLSIDWREDGPQVGKAVLAISQDGSFFNGFWYENRQLKGTWQGRKIDDGREPVCASSIKTAATSQIAEALESTGRAVLYGLYFDYDSDVLKPESQRTLLDLESWIMKNQNKGLIIEGHTDSDGSGAYNQDLSGRRAVSVKNWLTSRGSNTSNMQSIGLGEGRPVASNSTAQGKALNRRVEIHLSK